MFTQIIYVDTFIKLFLIISFSTFGLCIRNEENNETFHGKPYMTIHFFPRSMKIQQIQSRQYYPIKNLPDANIYNSNKIAFPNKYEDNVYNVIPEENVNTRQRENPYDSPNFNTGEYIQNTNLLNGGISNTNGLGYPNEDDGNDSNYYDYSQPPQNLPSNYQYEVNGNIPDVSNYQTYNDPNYYENNYPQNYNYFNNNNGNRQSNYNRRPPPPLPPIYNRYNPNSPPFTYYQRPSNFPSRPSPLRPAYYEPPPNSPGPFGISGNTGIGGGYPTFANPLMNFFNNFGAPGGEFSERFTKALDDIAKHDDLQCVPKLLCQMVGDPSRRGQLPSFVSAPAFTALVAAVPSASPTLIFGRAALLGFTGGESVCHTTYPKCPKNEDDLLYYLNNHRGGFFRFFNGGGSFGDDISSQYNPQQQHHATSPPNYNHHNRPSQSSGGANLQSFADSINQFGGVNLSNLGSNLGLLSNLASLVSSTTNQNPLSALTGGGNGGGTSGSSGSNTNTNVGEIVGNLLSGLVGSRRLTTRKLQKRSLPDIPSSEDSSEDIERKTIKIRKKKYDSESDVFPKKSLRNITKIDDKNAEEIEGRILNNPDPIFSNLDDDNKNNDKLRFIFPFDDDGKRNEDDSRYGKVLNFHDSSQYGSTVKFPSNYDDYESIRNGKRINFDKEQNYAPNYSFSSDNYEDGEQHRTKMIFPDRTGTGNLRFDSNQFKPNVDDDYDGESLDQIRYTRIVNRPNKYENNYEETTSRPYYSNSNRYSTTTYRPAYYQTTTHRPVYYNHYSRTTPTTTTRPSYSKYDYPNYNTNYYQENQYQVNRYRTTSKPKSHEPNLNVYVTNSQGVVEYYINQRGEKIRV